MPLDRDASHLCDDGLVYSSQRLKCEVRQAVSLRLQTEDFSLSLRKPGNGSKVAFKFIMHATGEAPFNLTTSITMIRSEASSGAVIAANGSIRTDQPSFSAFGQHIEWTQLPPATWLANLDGNRLKFEDTSPREFAVRLSCDHTEQSCAADGDVIATILQLVAVDSVPGNLHSEVRVLTHVQSLLSCVHSRVAVELKPGVVPISTPFRLRLFAKDVDDLPVSFTRAEIDLVFDGRSIPMHWSRGSNEYIADVPAEPTVLGTRLPSK